MSILTIVILTAVLLIIVFAAYKIQESNDHPELEYVKKRNFITPAEKSFFNTLKLVVEGKFYIFPHVQVASILTAKKDLEKSQKEILVDKIQRQHISFVLCHQSNLSLAAVIELNPFPARDKERDKHEDFLDQVFKGTGIPLIHFEGDQDYTFSDVKSSLAECLKQKQKPKAVSPLVPFDEDGFDFDVIQFDDESDTAPVDEEDLTMNTSMQVVCPKCSSVMVLRAANKGRRAGHKFWMCSAYPKCKRAIPTDDISGMILS